MTAPDTSPRPPDKRPASPTARQSDHPAAAGDFVPVYFDPVFKRVFADPADLGLLRSFLASVLGWPAEQLADLTLTDPHLGRIHQHAKGIIMDVRVQTASGDDIDIEIQLAHRKNFDLRMVYYTAEMFVNQLEHGEVYNHLRRAVCVAITDFSLIDNDNYHHRFQLHDAAQQVTLTEALQIDLLELPKLPPSQDGTLLWHWLRFISAQNEEEMDMAALADPTIARAAKKAKTFTRKETRRYRHVFRKLQEWDFQAHMQYLREQIDAETRAKATRDEQFEIARRMITKGLPTDTIAEITELTPEEVAALT